jgi:tRNA(Ile)-lysidine synthase
MDPRRFHKRLFDAAREFIPPKTTVVCAVSGGPDSMALLHGLHALNTLRRRGWRLHVAHLDHALRAESAADAAFVRAAAKSLGPRCTVRRIDVAAKARSAGETVEEAGRRLRYEFLEATARKAGAAVVAVAHHADDQAETVLHRIVRGTGLRGLAGMPQQRPIRAGSAITLVRPLLSFRRADLLAYLDRQRLAYRLDATNEDARSATRNRIRHEIMPLLAGALNPEITTALLRLSEQASRACAAIQTYAADALDRALLPSGRGEIVLDVRSLAGLPPAVRAEVILAALQRLRAGLGELGFERIEAAAALIGGDGRRRLIQLPEGASVERRGVKLLFHVSAGSRAKGSRR